DKKALGQLSEPGQDRASCAEGFLLDDVADLNSPGAAIAKMLFDEVGPITGKNDDLSEVVAFRQFDVVFEQWFAGDRDHRLGQIAQARLQAGAQAAGENDELFCVGSRS